MNRRYERKSSMYRAVKDTVKNAPQATIDQMPQMDTALNQLEQNIAQITLIGYTQSENRTGIAADKFVTKEEVANTIFILAGKVRSFAINSGNLELKDAVYFTISTLRGYADGNLVNAAQLVIQKAQENIAALPTYGVTPLTLTETTQLLSAYTSKMPKPRIGITNKKLATEELKTIFTNTDKLLDETMDTLVIIVKNTDTPFYNAYQNNRIIIDPAKTPLALRCFITDQDQNPIPNVIVTIQGYTKKHKTSAKGRIHIKSLPSGIHPITCQKFGYQTQVLSIPINKGERTDLRIVLQPTP